MDRTLTSRQTRIWCIFAILICAGILVGHVIYFAHPTILLLRIALLLGVVFVLFSNSKTLPPLFYGVLLYFVIYTAWTLFVNSFYDSTKDINLIINFLHIPLLIFVTLGILLQHPHQALKCLYIVSMAYILLQAGLGIVEHFSGWHLSTSSLCGASEDEIHLPTGLCYNPNDYAAMIALPMFFVIAYRKVIQSEKKQWTSIFWFVLVSVCIYWSGCRTIMLCEIAFVLFYYRTFIRKHWKTSLCFAALVLVATIFFVIHSDHSFSTRFGLYKEAFCSLFSSYGLGFGINGDQYYYQQLNNYDITSGYTNVHSYLFQLLLTSGLPIFLFYIALLIVSMRQIAQKQGRNELWAFPILYIFVLFAPSSSLFLWGQYLFFCAFVCYAALPEAERSAA